MTRWRFVSEWRVAGKVGRTWRCDAGVHVSDSMGRARPVDSCPCNHPLTDPANVGTLDAPVVISFDIIERKVEAEPVDGDALDFSVEALGGK